MRATIVVVRQLSARSNESSAATTKSPVARPSSPATIGVGAELARVTIRRLAVVARARACFCAGGGVAIVQARADLLCRSPSRCQPAATPRPGQAGKLDTRTILWRWRSARVENACVSQWAARTLRARQSQGPMAPHTCCACAAPTSGFCSLGGEGKELWRLERASEREEEELACLLASSLARSLACRLTWADAKAERPAQSHLVAGGAHKVCR